MCKINVYFLFGWLFFLILVSWCYYLVDFICYVEILDVLMFFGVGMVVFGLELVVILF